MPSKISYSDLIIHKSEKPSQYSPFLFRSKLSYPDISNQIEKMLKTLKKAENLPKDGPDYEFLINFFNNRKLGKIFASIMHRQPYFKQINENFPEEEVRDILFNIWLKINRKMNGYCQQIEKKKEILYEINRDFPSSSLVTKESVSLKSLFYDHSDNMNFQFCLDDVTARDIIVAYNSEVISYLTKKSSKIEFYLNTDSVPGDFYRKIFLRSRGLHLDYNIADKLLILVINAPIGIVGRNSYYRRRITRLFLFIIHCMINHRFQADLSIEIEYHNRKRVISISGITDIALSKGKEIYLVSNSIKQEFFDSKVEEEFYRKFKNFSSRWTIVREPEVIFLEDTVIIPDFVVSWADARIYIEIVGFWTTAYLDKKYKKLIKLNETEIDFIILVDKNLKLEDTCLPTFKYNSHKYPIFDIISFLDRKYYFKRFESQKKLIIERIIKEGILSNYIEGRDVIKKEDLIEFLHLDSIEELEAILQDSSVQQHFNKQKLIYIRVYGLILKNHFYKLKNEISAHLDSLFSENSSDNKDINYHDFKYSYEMEETLLIQLIESSGYEIEWKSLVNCMIKKTK